MNLFGVIVFVLFLVIWYTIVLQWHVEDLAKQNQRLSDRAFGRMSLIVGLIGTAVSVILLEL